MSDFFKDLKPIEVKRVCLDDVDDQCQVADCVVETYYAICEHVGIYLPPEGAPDHFGDFLRVTLDNGGTNLEGRIPLGVIEELLATFKRQKIKSANVKEPEQWKGISARPPDDILAELLEKHKSPQERQTPFKFNAYPCGAQEGEVQKSHLKKGNRQKGEVGKAPRPRNATRKDGPKGKGKS